VKSSRIGIGSFENNLGGGGESQSHRQQEAMPDADRAVEWKYLKKTWVSPTTKFLEMIAADWKTWRRRR